MFKIIIRNIAFLGLLSCSLSSMAGVNPLVVSLQSGASTSILKGSTGTADYLVALNPAVPGPLTLALTGALPSGVTQVTTGTGCGSVAACTSTFNLTPGGQCCLKLLMTGSNMALGNNIIQPLVQTTPIPTYSGRGDALSVAVTNAVSNTTITVSANGVIPVNDSLSGTLTVTNIGPNTAYNVRAVLPSAWAGVTQIATDCATIASPGTCTLLFTSDTPYLAQGGITVTGDNITSPPTTAIAFSIQGYLVFALSSPSSALPQVIDTTDLSNARWGSPGFAPGISLTDGSFNTTAIYIYSLANTGFTPSAAVNCYNSNSGGTAAGTWYLPAICQMGASVGVVGCLNSNTTTIDNLFQLGFVSVAGFYWSSTEFTPGIAWRETFSLSGSSPFPDNELNAHSVRCSRAITY